MLSKKGKYGLKAMVFLASIKPGERALVSDIARSRDIPRKFLETILVDLKNAGFLTARKGPQGGYSLSRPAQEILVGRVVRALDGALAPIPCASNSHYQPCEDCDEDKCEVRSIMLSVRMAICEVLDNCTLADLHKRREVLCLVDEPCE